MIELYWLPVGAGEPTGLVRLSSSVYEAMSAWRHGRPRQRLFHAALRIMADEHEIVVEMAPVWATAARERGVVAEGPVGFPWLGRFRWFRYEVRCWRGGSIPDLAYAVGPAIRVETDPTRVGLLLRAVPDVPTTTWGLDEQGTGEMWNSNSLVSWALATSGHDVSGMVPPEGGRAPGWTAGVVVAARGALSGRAAS